MMEEIVGWIVGSTYSVLIHLPGTMVIVVMGLAPAVLVLTLAGVVRRLEVRTHSAVSGQRIGSAIRLVGHPALAVPMLSVSLPVVILDLVVLCWIILWLGTAIVDAV